MTITQEELKALLDYDEVTGIFTWKVDRGGNARIGSIAGYLRGDGYRRINVNYKKFSEHRLAWLYCKGFFPLKGIDHIDGNKGNNSITNLREATHTENQFNKGKRRDNKSGYKGVAFHKHTSKWQANASLKGKSIYIGLFPTPEEAFLAYQEFALKNHGEFIHQSVATGLTN